MQELNVLKKEQAAEEARRRLAWQAARQNDAVPLNDERLEQEAVATTGAATSSTEPEAAVASVVQELA
eukprot:11653881-Heterocapsa_arctica.AAC.1